MKYSEFNGFGKISKLGFGLMRLPKVEKDREKIDFDEADKLIDIAIKNGVTYFDTAYFYHDGESELFVAHSLSRYPRESFCLATKLPSGPLKEGKTVDEIFNDQLKKCGVTYFDFYLFHAVSRDNMKYFEEKNAYEYLMKKKEEGVIRHLGFSYHGDLEFFKETLDKYKWDFAQLQINYYDWDAQNAKEYYKALEDRSVPCIVMEPVRGGSLQSLNDEARKVFEELGDASPASYALRYVGTKSNVLVVLSGMSAVEQVEDNIRTFSELKELSEEESAAVEKASVLFRKNFAIPCTACKYCLQKCPKGIDIPGCFKAYNEYNKTRDTADFKKIYDGIADESKAFNCIECGECMTMCPQSIEIPKKLRSVKDLAKGDK